MTPNIDPSAILAAIYQVLPRPHGFVALHEPRFAGNEWVYVKECLDTGWVSSVGKFVDRFEQALVEYTGIKHAVATVNGTAALHISLLLAGVSPGDEVIVPALTFVATANAVRYCGAVPHFVDAEERTLGLDPRKLSDYLEMIVERRPEGTFNRQTGRRLKAVVPMHTFGHPVDLEPLGELCAQFGLELVEDAAESLGSYYRGRHTGHWGRISAVSFNGNKIVTTGGGGAILTNDSTLAKRAKHLTTTAKLPHPWAFHHDEVGYNYRLPNLNAALGCAQLEQLPAFVSKKRNLAIRYQQAFNGLDGVHFFSEPDFAQSNYWLNAVLLEQPDRALRDAIMRAINDQNVMARPAWTLLPELPMYDRCPKMDLSVAQSLEARIINLPSSVILEPSDGQA
jgi:perosamine synthetase